MSRPRWPRSSPCSSRGGAQAGKPPTNGSRGLRSLSQGAAHPEAARPVCHHASPSADGHLVRQRHRARSRFRLAYVERSNHASPITWPIRHRSKSAYVSRAPISKRRGGSPRIPPGCRRGAIRGLCERYYDRRTLCSRSGRRGCRPESSAERSHSLEHQRTASDALNLYFLRRARSARIAWATPSLCSLGLDLVAAHHRSGGFARANLAPPRRPGDVQLGRINALAPASLGVYRPSLKADPDAIPTLRSPSAACQRDISFAAYRRSQHRYSEIIERLDKAEAASIRIALIANFPPLPLAACRSRTFAAGQICCSATKSPPRRTGGHQGFCREGKRRRNGMRGTCAPYSRRPLVLRR